MISFRTPHRVRTRDEVLPIYNLSAIRSAAMEMRRAYQEHDRDVQKECYHSVGDQDAKTNPVDIAHMHGGHFDDERCDTIHDGADGCKVVQGHKRIHLELCGAEEALNKRQPNGLKDDTTSLVEESRQNKGDFTIGRNHDTNDDEGNIAEGFHAWRRNSKRPCRQKHGNWCSGLEDVNDTDCVCFGKVYLEHLNKRNTEVKIGFVAADQTETEEEANGQNSS